jgi:hypothetical protein
MIQVPADRSHIHTYTHTKHSDDTRPAFCLALQILCLRNTVLPLDDEEIYTRKSFKIYAVCKTVLGYQIKGGEIGGHVAHVSKIRNAYTILIGKPENKRSLGRRKRRWEKIIKWILKETECEVANLITVVQKKVQWLAFVNTVLKFGVS